MSTQLQIPKSLTIRKIPDKIKLWNTFHKDLHIESYRFIIHLNGLRLYGPEYSIIDDVLTIPVTCSGDVIQISYVENEEIVNLSHIVK